MRVPNIHFEPESRQLQRARLEHLLSFSDLVMLLVAEQGLGRSHLLAQLKPEQSPMQPNWVHLSLETAFDVTHLLQALIALLGISCEPNNRARLTALHAYARELEQLDQRLHICVDDADYLSDNALELLLNFSKIDSAAPRVLLAGLPEFEQRFFEREFNRLVEGSLHVEHLQPYTAEEARAFVDAHLLDGRQLKDAEYRRLLLDSQGRPDLLKSALAKLLDKEPARAGVKGAVSNRWYWAGILLVLATTAGAIGYLYSPSATVEPAVTTPLEIPIPQVVQAAKQSEPELVAARSELSKRLEEQEQRLAEVADLTSQERDAVAESEPTEVVKEITPAPEPTPVSVADSQSEIAPETTQPQTPAPVVEELTPTAPDQQTVDVSQLPPGAELEADSTVASSGTAAEVAISVQAERGPEQEPQPTQQAVDTTAEPQPAIPAAPAPRSAQATSTEQTTSRFSADIETVLGWPATDLTVQLLAAREEQTADKLIARYGSATPMLKLSYPYKGSPRFTVVTGHYPSRAAANQAVSNLPAELQRLKPWIRSVTGLKSELNSALNP